MTLLGKIILGSLIVCLLDGLAEFLFPSLNNLLFSIPVKGINIFSLIAGNMVVFCYLIHSRRQLRMMREAAWQWDREVEAAAEATRR